MLKQYRGKAIHKYRYFCQGDIFANLYYYEAGYAVKIMGDYFQVYINRKSWVLAILLNQGGPI